MDDIVTTLPPRFWISPTGERHQLTWSQTHCDFAAQRIALEYPGFDTKPYVYEDEALTSLGWIRVGHWSSYSIWKYTPEVWARLLAAIPPILKAYDERAAYLYVDCFGSKTFYRGSIQTLRTMTFDEASENVAARICHGKNLELGLTAG